MQTEFECNMSKRIPGYDEIMTRISDIIAEKRPDPAIMLDTGCGTGALVRMLLPRFKRTQFVLADPSEDMISEAKKYMCGEQRCLYVRNPTHRLNFSDETLDVVTAVLSHHYYRTLEEKKSAISNCARMLKRGGLFITVEHVDNPPEEKDAKDREWRSFMSEKGLCQEDINEMFSRRNTEYFPIKESVHIDILKECGLNDVEIFWTSCSDIGIVAIKR